MRLYLLLLVNCGMYQNDAVVLRQHGVNWRQGTITRAQQDARAQRPGHYLQALAGDVRTAEEVAGGGGAGADLGHMWGHQTRSVSRGSTGCVGES
jgi:hypothetical protein